MVYWRTDQAFALRLAAAWLAVTAPAWLRAETETPAVEVPVASDGCALDTHGPTPNFCASKLEYEANKIVLHDIDIAQGGMRIKADLAEATGPAKDPFKNSNWVFSGNVQVWMPQGQLRADKAEAQMANGRINSTAASGAPASFEQQAQPGREPAHGHAQDIRYNVASSEVQLSGEAWLSNGCEEINGQRIVYNIVSQRVQADAQPGENRRIRGTIRPQCTSRSDSGARP